MSQKKSIDDRAVLEKALLVISAKGSESFTLSDVAQEVGLAPATLLQRFGSKQQLLVKAAMQAFISLTHDLKKLKEKGLSWKEELLELLIDMPEGFGSRQNIASSFGLLKLDMIDPELHPIVRSLFQQLRESIEELLNSGKANGEISSTRDLPTMAWELEALRHGLVIQWTLSGKGSLQTWLQKGFQDYLKRNLWSDINFIANTNTSALQGRSS